MRDLDDNAGDSEPNRHPSEPSLARIAARQLGVVARAQLIELGFSHSQIKRRLALGRLHRVHHNVYAVGHPRLTSQACLVAALLSVGPRSFLSHRTAAAAWGLRAVNVHDIELTLPGNGGRPHRSLTVHRAREEPQPDEVRNRGDLRVSSVPRMLVELAAREKPAELARLVTMAVQRRLLRLDAQDGLAALEAVLARHRRRPGMATLKAVLAAYRRVDSSKSELERAFDRLIAPHPEIPKPNANVHIGPWEIDRFCPAHNLAVELDGRPYHLAAEAMEKDRIKDAALLRQGITPLRFTDFRVEHDARGILADLRHFVGAGSGSGGMRPAGPHSSNT
jgi:very-short-patch-repair endonuclease